MPIPIPRARNIGLIGYTVSREDAPWGDPNWELQGLNNLHLMLRPEQVCQRWFDFHDPQTLITDPPHVEWLTKGVVPVYMMPKTIAPEFPSAVEFPVSTLDRLYRDEWKLSGWNYVTNSVSWMIMLAIAALAPGLKRGEGGQIGLWGIDMAVGGPDLAGEYAYQRPSCEYWLGVAEGLGINVYVADRADLLKCGARYGEHDDNPMAVKMRARLRESEEQLAQMMNQRNQLLGQVEHANAMVHKFEGVVEDQRYINHVWLPQGTNPRQGRDDPSMAESQPQV